MKLLGIDYGTKRVGISLSDESGKMAFPHDVFKNDKKLVDNVKSICEEETVSAIVMGESKDYKQKENPLMVDIYKFKTFLDLFL